MHLNFRAWRPLVVLSLAGSLLSCGGDGPTEPPPPAVATKLAFVTAPPGTAAAGEALDPQPVVQLQDAEGAAVAKSGVVVTATLEGGTVTGATATTASNGRATFSGLALSAAAGTHMLHFDAPSLTGLAQEMTIEPSLSMSANSPQAQNGFAGWPVEHPPSVKVIDAIGQPVAGVPVVFARVAGNGSLTDAVGVTATVETGPDGIATVGGWTLGQFVGANAVTARAQGVAELLTFSADGVLLGNLTGLNVLQVAGVGTAVAPPTVIVYENAVPKPGVSVRFRVTAGGGSVLETEVVTDADGVASCGSWTLGAEAGKNVLEIDVPGYAVEPIHARAWGVLSMPASIVIHAGDGQVAGAGQTLPVAPAIRTQDQDGNPLAGYPVFFIIAEPDGSEIDGGAITGSQTETDANGIAVVGSWQMPLSSGVVHLEAFAPELAGTPVYFTATVP